MIYLEIIDSKDFQQMIQIQMIIAVIDLGQGDKGSDPLPPLFCEFIQGIYDRNIIYVTINTINVYSKFFEDMYLDAII